MEKKKRGPYKRYLWKEKTEEIPTRTKLHLKKKKHQRDLENDAIDLQNFPGDSGETRNNSNSPVDDNQSFFNPPDDCLLNNYQDENFLQDEGSRRTNESDADHSFSDIEAEHNYYIYSWSGSESEGSDTEIEFDNSEYSRDSANEANVPTEKDFKEIESEAANQNYSAVLLKHTLLVLAVKLRNNLNNKTTQHIAELLNVVSDSYKTHASTYHLKKIVNSFSTPIMIYHICPTCNRFAGEATKVSNEIVCSDCQCIIDVNENKIQKNTFLHLSLRDQLQKLFERYHDIVINRSHRIKQRYYALEDIMDGRLYQKHISPLSDESYITLNFSLDGTPLFDSSPSSIVPLLCTINELPPILRQRKIMLVSLHMGQTKPNIDEFLKPFVAETKELYEEGFNYTYNGVQYNKKVKILLGISDSVQRPDLRGSKSFRGKYGCGLCKNKGKEVAKGRGFVRVYPLDNEGNAYGEGLRSHTETLFHAIGQEKGIKRRSILCDIPEFDIIDNIDADWMHCVPLGVCRQFLTIWFDSQYHSEKYYLGPHLNEVDNLLTSIRPTSDVARTPRKMSDRNFWKAHELVNWLLFYSLPILNIFLPKKYAEHWSLLIDAINILLNNSIVEPDVYYAQQCIFQFVDGVSSLYDEKHLSFNVHLLTHLPQSVLNWGPLWTHSAFCFENNHQKMKKMVHSSNSANLQICETIRANCALNELLIMYKDQLSPEQQSFLCRTKQTKTIPVPKIVIENVGLLGKPNIIENLDVASFLALQRINVNIDKGSLISIYSRIIIEKNIIHSELYNKVKKRNNFTVQLIDDEIFHIKSFLLVSVANVSTCMALGKYSYRLNNTFFPGRRLNHMIFLKENEDDSLTAINANMIKHKVIFVRVDSNNPFFAIACIFPNKLEMLT